MTKDDAHDEGYEGVIIPFPDPKAEQANLGPFCDKCRGRHFARNEGRGKCGHKIFFAGINYCGRCSIMHRTCRCCGADLTVVFRRMEAEREQSARRGKREKNEKPRMKVFKR